MPGGDAKSWAQYFLQLLWANGDGWQPPDLDFSRQCTSEDTGRECWLCFDLPPWNCVLNPLGLNLSEKTPGLLELATIKLVDSSHFGSPNDRQACCSVFFLAWLPRKHRCVQFLSVRREVPYAPYYVWQLASEACKFGAGTQCHLREVVWKTRSEHWGVLEFFQRYAAKLETLKVSFEQQSKAAVPYRLRQLIRFWADTLKVFSICMLSQHDACERLIELRLCRSLVELEVFLPDDTSTPDTIARILSSEACSALRKLSIFYPPYSVGDHAFADALSTNRTLLEVCVSSPSIEAFRVVCNALTKNTSVRKLILVNSFSQVEMTPDDNIASLLRRNSVLESLTLAGFQFFVESPGSIVNALADNAALKLLTCISGVMLCTVVSQLVSALERNGTLQCIQLEAVHGSREQKQALAALVASLGCSHRLDVQEWEDEDLRSMSPLLASPQATPRDVWLVVNDILPGQASALRTALAGPDRAPVGKLILDCMRRWPPCVKDAVSDILITNSSLHSLAIVEDVRHLEFEAYYHDLAAVCSAVWRSSNLSHLSILSPDHLDRVEYAEWLVAVLRNSKSIISLSLLQQSSHRSAEKTLDATAMGLLLNPFIVDIDIDGPVQDSRDFIFSRTVTRNRSRVNNAARFVTGTDSSPRCARAFDLLHTKQSLLQLLTCLRRGSQDDARAEIRTALGRMRENFLRFAGVVESSVTCWPADVTPIDSLNTDCWLALGRYLKLHDVCVYQR